MRSLKQAKAELAEYGTLYSEITSKIECSTNEQLEVLADASELLNQTNCWWAVYGVAPIVAHLAKVELAAREWRPQ